MKKVNLTKYGFVRWPEKDFSDDGSKFSVYRAGKALEVSKLVSDGQIYLSISACDCGNGTLPYEVYSKLPYYQEATWSYNGISVDTLTDEDVQAFYDACIEYENAYLEEEAHIVYPTLDEIKEQCKKIMVKTMKELDEIENILKNRLVEVAVRFSEYDWKELKNGINKLTSKMAEVDKYYPARIHKTAYSFNFVRPDNTDLTTPNYWYSDIMDRFKKYGIIKK